MYINNGFANFRNCFIYLDSATGSHGSQGAGIYCNAGKTLISNTTLVRNNVHALYKGGSAYVEIINSIIFFNNNSASQIFGSPIITFSDVEGSYAGTGNININPILDTNQQIVFGSLCIDAGNPDPIYNDICFPPSQGGVQNDMGAQGGPGACDWINNSINLNLTVLMEGLYNPPNNKTSRSADLIVLLREAAAPYKMIEYAGGSIDSLTFTGMFNFNVAPTGTYYLVTKNFNTLETWSKDGGKSLTQNNSTATYDFTNAAFKAYGDNQTLIDTKYCLYSGDVNQDGSVNLSDNISINNEAILFASGYISTDLNGDEITDLTDLLFASNNASNFVAVIKP